MEHFRRLWLAVTISLLGDYLAMFAVQAAIVFRMHATAREVSAVFVASLLPTIVMGPFAGVFVDRWDARRTMIASDVARAALLGALAFANTLWQIYAISFAVSCVSAFFAPAFSIAVPRLVEPGALLKANARLQQSGQAARIASPAFAAALVAGVGAQACYWADSASFLISAAMIATLPAMTPSKTADASRQPVAICRDLADGIRLIGNYASLRFATFSMAVAVFATGCFTTLISVYVRDVLGDGANTYGKMGTLIATGTLGGSLLMNKFARKFARVEDSDRCLIGGLSAVGVFIVLLGVAPTRVIALAGSLGIGMGAAVAMAASAALVQGRTPAGMRGRISSVSASLTSMAQGAAILLAGGTAAWIGVRPMYAFSGLLLLSQPVFRYCRRQTDQSTREACFQSLR